MRRLVNPFEIPGRWYRANLHAHTCWFGGDAWPKRVVACYRDRGYDVLALTDHERTHDVRRLPGRKMLVINGTELHPPLPRVGGGNHLLCLNLPHAFPISRRSQRDTQACLSQVAGMGGLNILSHPHRLDMRTKEFVNLKHLHAFEVWTTVDGPSDGERIWAAAMDCGFFIPAVASDDAHRLRSKEAFGGWTWLKMKSLTTKDVLTAIKSGACYASTGPKIHDFCVVERRIVLTCSATKQIAFKGPKGKDKLFRARAGQLLRRMVLDMPDWPFIRAVVTDKKGRSAWTNPIRLRGRR